jgi:hypothetical protein
MIKKILFTLKESIMWVVNALKKGDLLKYISTGFWKNRFKIIQLEKDNNTLISFESTKNWSTIMGYFFHLQV